MPALEDRLAELATRPPVGPTPVTEIQGRARRRVRRRRVVTCSAVVLVVVVLGVGVAALVSSSSGDPGEDVLADGGPSSSTTSSPPSLPSTSGVVPADPSLTLTPASGYIDGSVVEMALAEPASGAVVVAQCASEALDDGADLAAWCVAIEDAQADALLPYSLTRAVETVAAGPVDCAETIGRCVLTVRVGGRSGTDDRWAPLAFSPDLGPLAGPDVTVDGDEGTVGDGDALLVTLEGVATGQWIVIQQCRTDVPAHLADPTGSQCDNVRSRSVDVQDGPETQLTFTAFHDVYVNDAPDPGGGDPAWVPCSPCELQIYVAGAIGPVARLPLAMEPTDAPIRPTITLDPATDHVPGGTVTVRAAGLQPSTRATIGWCLLVTAQGGGGSPCSGPTGVMLPTSYAVAVDGTVVVEGFALPRPDQEAGEECLAVPDTCGIGIDSGDGTTTVAITPLDLTG